MIPLRELAEANQRLHGRVKVTPLQEDPSTGWLLKWENRQITGSFKLRGAMNKVLSLPPGDVEAGLVCASAGNHGQGVAVAGQAVGSRVVVFASENAVPSKVAAMQALGAEVTLVKGGYEAAEAAGKEFARQSGMVWVSPYNDVQVICGQASLGYEVLEQMAGRMLDELYLPVGGGGLAVGVGTVMKNFSPTTRVIGVQSEASAYMHQFFQHGSQAGVVEGESLADGLAGAVEEGSVTLELIRQNVDEMVLVTEEEISRAIAFAWRRYGERIEGSAAVALAAARRIHQPGQLAAVLISGGNIQPATHEKLLVQFPGEGLS